MFNEYSESIEWGNRSLTISTGTLARRAHSSLLFQYGNSTALCAITIGDEKRCEDFLPLTVNVILKSYAVGKIPSGFIKREKISEKEILLSRMADRAIRPLFPKSFNRDVFVLCTVLDYDTDNDLDSLVVNAVSATLAISDIPISNIVAAAKIGIVGDNYVLSPSLSELNNGELDLLVSGHASNIMMIECSSSEVLCEDIEEAILFAHESLRCVIECVEKLKAKIPARNNYLEHLDKFIIDLGIKPADLSQNLAPKNDIDYMRKICVNYVDRVYSDLEPSARNKCLRSSCVALCSQFVTDSFSLSQALSVFKNAQADVMYKNILEENERLDGRKSDEIRPIECKVDCFNRSHGSAFFARGGTQALVSITLGGTTDEQIVDDIEGDRKESFLLHYNFPTYSVGDAAMPRAASRREIGHGRLAWKAIKPVLPKKDEFPYTVRVVSEILESDGSSSMATVCGATLALMDAGVPIKTPVAGIAMGLIKDDEKYTVLTDILGEEDFLGEMDFKVAGTKNGITALQMDMKVNGISFEIIRDALAHAQRAVTHILKKITDTMPEPRKTMKSTVPTICSIKVDQDKIKDVIGASGKTIKNICQESGAKVDIGQDGVVTIFADTQSKAAHASDMIRKIIDNDVGKVYDINIKGVERSGASVEIIPDGREGYVHISDVRNGYIASLDSIVSVGDNLKAMITSIDASSGVVRLSIKSVDQETGKVVSGGSFSGKKPSFNRKKKNYS